MKTGYDKFYPDYPPECDFYEFFDPEKLDKRISKDVVIALRYLTHFCYFDNEGSLKYEDFLQLKNSEHESNKTAWEQIKERLSGIRRVLKIADPKIWLKAEKIFPGYPKQGQVWLITAIYESFLWMGYGSQQVVTESNFIAWKNELLEHLEKAAKLSYNMPPNAYEWISTLRQSWHNKANQYFELEDDSYQSRFIDLHLPHAHEQIEILKSSLEIVGNDPSFFRKQINKATGPRDYFMRSLTCAFLQETGKPYRSIVAEATSAAFDCALTQPEVTRATRDIEPDNHFPVVHRTQKSTFCAAGIYPDYEPDDPTQF